MSGRAKISSFLSDPSLLLAIPATVAYYAIVFQSPFHGGVLFRYTTEHFVEYVIVAMFIWGVIDIVLKTCSFPKELWALRQEWMPPREGRIPTSQAEVLLEQIQSRHPRLLRSRAAQRLIHALSFVVENKSAEELPEQLKYLSEQDQDATYNRYSLVNFVVAVTPILGFLGTVVHFGSALSGMTIQNMEQELSNVVSEMGTAFNTTTVALGASMVTMFAKFLCERTERGIDGRVDRLAERELLNRFEVKTASLAPLESLLVSANQEFHAAIEQTLQNQITNWSNALHGLFEHFDQRQKEDQQRWLAMCAEMQQRHQSYDHSYNERLQQIISIADARHDRHLEQIQTVITQATGFSSDLGTLARTLQEIASGEGKLADLQNTLTDNLKVLHETHQIDAALHGLTAAIHLLTVRHQVGPGSKAA